MLHLCYLCLGNQSAVFTLFLCYDYVCKTDKLDIVRTRILNKIIMPKYNLSTT